MKPLVVMFVMFCAIQRSHATITMFYNIHQPAQMKQQWANAAGPYTRIDFTGFPANTIITNQYAHLGVTFTDGTDRILYTTGFLEVGVGINGAFDFSRIAFSQPMHTLAFDYLGGIRCVLYSGTQVIFDTGSAFAIGFGGFVGIVSTEAFDSVQISDPEGGLFYDTLYFGAPVPAPAGLTALLAGLFARPGRRRR